MVQQAGLVSGVGDGLTFIMRSSLALQVLLLAWKMGAQRMGYFSRSEFESGARALKAYDAKALRRAALALEDEVAAPSALLAFATFAFKFCLTVRGLERMSCAPSRRVIDAMQRSLHPCSA